MTINTFMSDEAVLQEIGRSMARRRVELELTQAALAEQAGVAKRTVERIEAGLSTQTANLIRIFRVSGAYRGPGRPDPGNRTAAARLAQAQRQTAATSLCEKKPRNRTASPGPGVKIHEHGG